MPIHTFPDLRRYALLARALGNERRLYILQLLLLRSYSEIEIAEKLGIHKSAASRHLHVLLKVGLIISQRKAGSVEFSIAPNLINIVHTLVDLFVNSSTSKI